MESLLLFCTCISCILALTPGFTQQVTDQIGDPLEKQYGEIRYAALIFRHGDRNPTQTGYPSDPYRNYSWPEGYGQLTRKGKQRLFKLGSWFKRRYHNLVRDSYDRKDIIMESSDTDRTIMSGQCFLRGFYPATGPQVWQENEQWQPIPIHTIPQKHDNMIALTRKCPRMEQLMSDTFADPKYTQIYQNYKDSIEYIANHAGFNVSKPITESLVVQMLHLYDTLFTESKNNLKLPKWTIKVYPEPLVTILALTEYRESYGAEGKRLLAGPILKSITSDVKLKNKNANLTRKLHLYSAHEFIVSRVMVALGVPTREKPPYGTTLMFELRKRGNADLVTISIKNTTNGQPHLLSIPGCNGTVCTLEEFLYLTEPLIPRDWEQECRVSSSLSHFTNPNHFLLIVAFVLIFY